jgi:hypothetical protein
MDLMTQAVALSLVLTLFNSVFAGSSWQAEKSSEGIQILTQTLPNSKLKAFRGLVTLKTSLPKVIQVFEKMDQHKNWLNRASKSKVISTSPNQTTVYMNYDSPWPVTDRDVFLQYSKKEISSSRIEYQCKSLDSKKKTEGYIRIHSLKGRWIFEEVDTQRVKVTYEQHANSGGNIPTWLANAAVTDVPIQTLKNFRELF